MTVTLTHPWTGQADYRYDYIGEAEVEVILARAAAAAPAWAARPLEDRSALLRAVAVRLRDEREAIAAIMSADMGKLRREAPSYLTACGLAMRRFLQ